MHIRLIDQAILTTYAGPMHINVFLCTSNKLQKQPSKFDLLLYW